MARNAKTLVMPHTSICSLQPDRSAMLRFARIAALTQTDRFYFPSGLLDSKPDLALASPRCARREAESRTPKHYAQPVQHSDQASQFPQSDAAKHSWPKYAENVFDILQVYRFVGLPFRKTVIQITAMIFNSASEVASFCCFSDSRKAHRDRLHVVSIFKKILLLRTSRSCILSWDVAPTVQTPLRSRCTAMPPPIRHVP